MKERNIKTIIIFFFALLVFLSVAGARIVNNIMFEREVLGHLKLAADANTVTLAEAKLKRALNGAEEWGICNDGGECFTSVVYRTPDEDLGFWRQNLEASLADLQAMSPEEREDNLIESNQLMKLRETILDTKNEGEKITYPTGISVYPYNRTYTVVAWLSFLVLAITGIKELFRE